MNFQVEPPTIPLAPPPKQRFKRTRAWLRTPTGCIVLPLISLLIGILLGFFSLFLVAIGGDGQLHPAPAVPATGNIVIEIDKTFLTHLLTSNLQSSGLPGTVQNVQVTMVPTDEMSIQADDEFSILGIGASRHFTLVVQLFASSCTIQTQVVHADVGSIPVTGFVQIFQGNINSQFQTKPSGLPKGFTYCASGVRTETQGMFVTYTATPV